MKIILQGLDCANCSAKIEAEVNKLDYVKHAEFNFITKELTLELSEERSEESTFSDVERIVKYYEPDVIVKKLTGDVPEAVAEHFSLGKYLKKYAFELVGILLLLGAHFLSEYTYLHIGLSVCAYLLISYDILWLSLKNIARGQVFDENFLMSIATIGAMILGDFTEGAAVMLFYKVGEGLSDYAQEKSVRSIDELLKLKIPYANVITMDGTKQVRCEEVVEGDLLIVRPGESIPVDAKVLTGSAYADTKSVTGESALRHINPGQEVYAGYIVTDSPLTVRALRSYENSMIAKIIYLTREASQNKAPTEKFITKFARIYTPCVVGLAVLLAVVPPLLGYGELVYWAKKSLIFLVISCPCALVLSIPLGYFAGIGAASRSGILIKGANYIEELSKADTAVFDKTGTLTKGNFVLTEQHELNISSEEFREYLLAAEHYSRHPLAEAIRASLTDAVIAEAEISDYSELAGKGVSLTYRGRKILAGSAELCGAGAISAVGSVVCLNVDGSYCGYVVLADEVKDNAVGALQELKGAGIERLFMLSGDRTDTANAISARLGLDGCSAELLPAEKVDAFGKLKGSGRAIYVGDGINDAPVIAVADVGAAMGALGSEAAVEAADVVVMTDDLATLAKAVKISKFTKRIITENIAFVLFIKLGFMALGAFGIANMAQAVFADVGTAVLATLNSMRVLRRKY